MRLTSNNYCRHGLTLIEVVAGLALMGTLLAAMLIAKGRFTQQHHYAQRVLVAVDAADALLTTRWNTASGSGLEDWGSGGGQVVDSDTLTWRTVEITDDRAAALHSRIIRLELFDNLSKPNDPPLVSIDLLLPMPAEEAGQTLGTENSLNTDESTPLTESVL